jgi:hypothetical protein
LDDEVVPDTVTSGALTFCHHLASSKSADDESSLESNSIPPLVKRFDDDNTMSSDSSLEDTDIESDSEIKLESFIYIVLKDENLRGEETDLVCHQLAQMLKLSYNKNHTDSDSSDESTECT